MYFTLIRPNYLLLEYLSVKRQLGITSLFLLPPLSTFRSFFQTSHLIADYIFGESDLLLLLNIN